jgi:menaquinone-dependent protoporphyrinogen oxidase
MRVLVAYATKTGGTAGIAKAAGEELQKLGLATDVLDVGEVRNLSPYQAVVLGSAVYFGKWRKEALRFADRHAEELRQRSVWLFESGPTDTSADEGKAAPAKTAEELAREIGARGPVVFGGRFMPENAGPITRRLVASGEGGASFGDYRNFDRIRNWAREIGEELLGAKAVEAA